MATQTQAHTPCLLCITDGEIRTTKELSWDVQFGIVNTYLSFFKPYYMKSPQFRKTTSFITGLLSFRNVLSLQITLMHLDKGVLVSWDVCY